jgi:diguanylate cyclase (GGDEF)-like protein
LIGQGARSEECFSRYGGEEFAMMLPESELDKAGAFAGKLLQKVSGSEFVFEGRRIPVTISVGVARMIPEMTEPTQLIKTCDAALYKAKQSGRNRVELA